MTDLLVELIHGAHLKNKKGGLGALKRKVAAAAALSEGARKERKVGGASKSDLRKQGGSDQFVQVCTVKRDRRTIEDIEVGPITRQVCCMSRAYCSHCSCCGAEGDEKGEAQSGQPRDRLHGESFPKCSPPPLLIRDGHLHFACVCAEFSDQNEVCCARADTFARHRSVASTRRVDTKAHGTAAHRSLFALTRLRVQRKLIESQ